MRRLRSTTSLLSLLLAISCSSGGGPEPSSILSMRYPVFSAEGPAIKVRIDQDGRIEQAIRLAGGAGWEVFSSSVREDRFASLMTETAKVPPVQFREPESSERYFTVTAETVDGRIALAYNDASLPCADDAVRRFQSVWTRLNDVLPRKLPESELPRCATP